MRKQTVKKVISAMLSSAIALSVLMPSLSLTAKATASDTSSSSSSTSQSQPLGAVTTTTTPPTATPTPAPTSTPAPSSVSKAFIANYVVLDANNNEKALITPGETVNIAFTIIDERVKFTPEITGKHLRARMAQGAFKIDNVDNVSYGTPVSTMVAGESGSYEALRYVVVFNNVKYLGGAPSFAFDFSYINESGTSFSDPTFLSLPYTQLTQNISQAIDDVPAPTVILNSANYGKAAVVGQNFTLATVATNTSSNLAIENVSVRIELPASISLTSGNSQVLMGKIQPNGKISHNFNLVVDAVANDVSTLPVKLVYTFEAFVSGKRTSFTSTQELSINVEQPTKFSISNVNFMETINMGEETGITVSLVNKGKTTVSNVSVEFKSDTLTDNPTTFVGNINPGAEGSADIYIKAQAVGTLKGKLIVTYEDTKGRSSTLEKEITMQVMEPPIMPDKDPMMPEEPVKKGFPLWAMGLIAVAVGAGGFVAFKKIKAKKEAKRIEEENEDI